MWVDVLQREWMKEKEFDLAPAELGAIETHKYYLSEKEGREVSFEEALVDFLIYYESEFCAAKQRDDSAHQCDEIRKYKWIQSEKEGHDIGEEKAAKEWIEKYSSVWRIEQESLERYGFQEIHFVADRKEAIEIGMNGLASIAWEYQCDLYMHLPGMKYYNFILFGKKEYLNVKSIICPATVEVPKGEEMELIATGGRAKEALEAARGLMSRHENQ
jgi:phosphotransferase system HPr-like phosphotransfer protein